MNRALLFLLTLSFVTIFSCHNHCDDGSCDAQEIKSQHVRCLIFYFDGCSHCTILKKDIDKTLQPLGWKVGPQQDFEYVDVHGADPRVESFRKGGKWSCPTLVLIDTTGKEIARNVGRMKAKDLSEWVNNHRR